MRVVLLAAFALVGSLSLAPARAEAPVCGVSSQHTICLTIPPGPLSGAATIEVSNSPNGGRMLVSWEPNGGRSLHLLTRSRRSGVTNDYSFVWPTQKYLDGSGSLKAKIGSGAWVSAPVTLANGNVTDFQHSDSDWANYLPGSWTTGSDPAVAAVGDGPDDTSTSNAVAASVAAANPALFLFLGDVYEEGTFTENLNMYGQSSLGGAPGSLWGSLANRTQPTIGNHEHKHVVDFMDYWHGRPAYTSFTFGGVLFLDLNSSASLAPGTAQYGFVEQELLSAPDCVVSFFHIPVLSGGTIASNKQAVWALLADNGGDLVLNGHNHFMMEYQPLAGDLISAGHMVELISGAGGHSPSPAKKDDAGRIAWSLGSTPGVLYLSLEGAAAGGTASAISWRFEKTNGTVVRTGSVSC